MRPGGDEIDLDEPRVHAVVRAGKLANLHLPETGKSARALIDRSRREPARVFRLERAGRKALVLRGGNRVLFLVDKVV